MMETGRTIARLLALAAGLMLLLGATASAQPTSAGPDGVSRGWLGVRIQNVTDEIAVSLKLKKPTGALVAGVTPGSPAEKGDIEAGDVILTFDGKEVPQMRALPRIVAGTEIGKSVDVQVLRKGKKRMLTVRIERLPETPAAKAEESKGATSGGGNAAGEVPEKQPDTEGLGKLD